MDNQPRATDYANEKQDVAFVEHKDQTPTDSSLELQKELTLSGVDMKNSRAFKGDDSDGQMEFTLRGKFSACFLAALYTGKFPFVVTFLTMLSFRADQYQALK